MLFWFSDKYLWISAVCLLQITYDCAIIFFFNHYLLVKLCAGVLFLSMPIVQQTQVADPEEHPEFNNQSTVFVMAWCNPSRAADVQEVGGPGLLPTEQESKVNGNESGVSYRVSLQSSSEFPLFSHPVGLYQFSTLFRHATGVLVTPYWSDCWGDADNLVPSPLWDWIESWGCVVVIDGEERNKQSLFQWAPVLAPAKLPTEFSFSSEKSKFPLLPIMTAAMVRSTKAFLMKNPLTSSFEMFFALFMASSDRDWILARIWLRPLRVLCGFSPLLWVMAVVCRAVIKAKELKLLSAVTETP